MIVRADARRIPLPDESVQCVVTSPPYWGLRKYAGAQDLVWLPIVPAEYSPFQCEHQWAPETQRVEMRQGKGLEKLSERYRGGGHSQAVLAEPYTVERSCCIRCGAWRGSFGLEPTIEMYVAHTIEILREIRRVLRSDGVCFWNIGDSYNANYRVAGPRNSTEKQLSNAGTIPFMGSEPNRQGFQNGVKPKDLCLIPERIALAAQADVSQGPPTVPGKGSVGKIERWWVRSMIIWAKPNPMPESVTDRPTDAYEHIIMLTKSERYFWDADAVREPGTSGPSDVRKLHERRDRIGGKTLTDEEPLHKANATTNIGRKRAVGNLLDENTAGRNIRNVWTMATQPYRGAHFATFPEEIPRRCIRAATRVGDLVLDPFAGSGTTGRVAVQLNRQAVLLDLAYQDHADKRTRNVQRQLLHV